MNVEELRRQFPDEESCRAFFESVIWPDGSILPPLPWGSSLKLRQPQNQGRSLRMRECGKQFTVSMTKTFYGTKLSWRLWLQAMYSLIFSSKQPHRYLLPGGAGDIPEIRLEDAARVAHGHGCPSSCSA